MKSTEFRKNSFSRIPLVRTSVLCCTLLTMFFANADVTITDQYGNNMQYSEKFIKHHEDGQGASIFSLVDEKVIMINHSREEYSEMSAAKLCEATEKMAEIFSLLGTPEHGEVSIIKGESNIVIAGYSTTQYLIKQGGILREIIWLASDRKLRSELEKYNSLDWINDCFGGSDDYDDSKSYKALMSKGVVLKSYSGDEYNLQEVLAKKKLDATTLLELEASEVVNIDFSDIPAAEFEVNANYTKVSREAMMTDPSDVLHGEMNADVSEKEREPEVTDSDNQDAIDKLKTMAEESEEGKVIFKALGKLFGSDDQS